jgi:hypothetical protein
MSKQTLVEIINPLQAQLIAENLDYQIGGETKKRLYMKGIFIQANVQNLNERVYPLSEITHAVNSIKEQLQSGYSILGELDHPEELTLNVQDASHKIVDMWMEGNNGMGKLQVLSTPMGQIVKTLILEDDVKLGVSSRGMGNVTDRGIVEGFEIVTVDIVAKPSAPSAYPRAIVEAKNLRKWGKIENLAINSMFDPNARKYLREELLNAFKNEKFFK